jgi:hypothetical protein
MTSMFPRFEKIKKRLIVEPGNSAAATGTAAETTAKVTQAEERAPRHSA